MTSQIRVQIISEATLAHALKENASSEVSFIDHDLVDNDLHFGLVEVAAIVALATSMAKLAEILVRIYKDLTDDDLEVVVKTANGEIIVKGKDFETVETLMKRLKEVV